MWWLFISGRTIATGVFLILLAVLNAMAEHASPGPVFTLAILQFVTNLFYAYLWRTRGSAILGHVAFSGEIVLITALIHLLGSGGWVFALAYFWPIIVGGWLMGRKVILQLTVVSGVCFTLLILGQRTGLLPQPDGVSFGDTPQALLLAYPYLAFIALLVWVVTREMEDIQHDLARTNVELLRERNLLRGILAAMSEAVCVVDPDGTVVLANRSAERLLETRVGASLPEWLHDPAISEIPGPDVPKRIAVDRGDRTLSVSAAALPLPPDERGGRLLVALDVTEQVHLERLKSDFVSYASHELRTPLTTIKMMVRLLLMDAPSGTQQEEYLSVIETQVDRQTRLVNNLLDFTRLEAGRYTLQPELVHPSDAVRSALSACKPLAQEKGLHLVADLERAPERMVSDSSALEQVLVNLISNAVKFTEPGGRVEVSCRLEGQEVVYEVADTGIGMNPEQLGRIFTRFYTVHHPKKHGEGTGLGLAITKMIVEELGGRIDVQSEAGVGTRFAVRLPLEESSAVEAPTPTPERLPSA